MSRIGRKKGVARLRRRLRAEFVLLGLLVASFLTFQTWSEHRLDTLGHQRLEYSERLASAQAGLASAQLTFVRESEQGRIVSRARAELGFVDAEVGERVRLALPAAKSAPEDPLLWRLAGGLDRFSGIREAFAAEDAR
ncbi:hypothetical protein DRQ53_09270 [bacterium]|nr:MAG: hypothetical protein DRQ53_09270 [bacterium]